MVAGVHEFDVPVETYDYGKARVNGELHVLLDAGQAVGIHFVGLGVGIVLPPYGEAYGIESGVFQELEVVVADGVAPAGVQTVPAAVVVALEGHVHVVRGVGCYQGDIGRVALVEGVLEGSACPVGGSVPGVSEVDSLAESIVHGAAQGVVHGLGVGIGRLYRILSAVGCSRLVVAPAGPEAKAEDERDEMDWFHDIPR